MEAPTHPFGFVFDTPRSDEGLSQEFLDAEAKWPPGHPERVQAAFKEFRGRFEPEFFIEVRRARLMSRYAMTMPPDWQGFDGSSGLEKFAEECLPLCPSK